MFNKERKHLIITNHLIWLIMQKVLNGIYFYIIIIIIISF